MSGSLLVPCDDETTLEVTGPLHHECPFVDEHDAGTITIRWATAGATFELHALRAWLAGFAREKVTHEHLTRSIALELAELEGIDLLAVTTRWRTAGFDVTVDGAVLR